MTRCGLIRRALAANGARHGLPSPFYEDPQQHTAAAPASFGMRRSRRQVGRGLEGREVAGLLAELDRDQVDRTARAAVFLRVAAFA